MTIKGRPVAAVTPLDEGDWERQVVSCDPAFRSILEQSQERCRAGHLAGLQIATRAVPNPRSR